MGRSSGKAKKSRPGGSRTKPKGRSAFAPPGLRLWEMLTLSDQTDEYGRLLLEDSAPERAIFKADQRGVLRETAVCPYGDTPSRLGGLMNESAYEALRRDTGDILDGFAWLVQRYAELDPSKRSTVQGLVDVSHLGLSMPLVLFGRARDPVPPHGRLPSYIASLFKASRGVFSAAVDMAGKRGRDTAISAADAVAFADLESHFRRPQTDRVCAAPTRLIERTIAVMLTGEGADAPRSDLGRMVDFEELWAFYAAEAEFSAALSDYGYVFNNLVSSGPPADPEALFRSVIWQGEVSRTFGDYTEEMLRRANSAQARLNDLLGRSKSAARVTFKDLAGMV